MNIITVILLFLFTNLNAQTVVKRAIDTNPLQVGDTIPNEELKDINGNVIYINELLVEKPTLLIFYRGGWCPYCNMHLSDLRDSEQSIIDLGYQIIAISPDQIIDVKRAVDKKEYKYTLLSDYEGKLITNMGLAFKSGFLTKTFANLRSKGEASKILPIPSVYIVNQEGLILYKHSDPNYKTRLSSEEIIKAIEEIDSM